MVRNHLQVAIAIHDLLTTISVQVPSSLPMVLSAVTACLNEGRAERGEEVLDEDDVASYCTNNAAKFFGFKL